VAPHPLDLLLSVPEIDAIQRAGKSVLVYAAGYPGPPAPAAAGRHVNGR